MTHETSEPTRLCAHPGCTCHVFGESTFCSDSCSRRANTPGAEVACPCGHAACRNSSFSPTARASAPPRAGNGH